MSSSTVASNPPQQQFNSHADPSPLRKPILDDNAHISITLVVLIPIIFTFILCLITACLYRYKKRRAQRNLLNPSMTSINQDDPTAISTICYNPHLNSFIIEEFPPSYDLISDIKKDLSLITGTNNTNEQFHLSPSKSEMIMGTPPPPYKSDFMDSTKMV